MKYAVLFGLFGLVCLAYAGLFQGIVWLLVWPGVSFLVVAAAYAGVGVGVFGKRQDGGMAWWALLLLLPYLLLTWSLWHVQRLLSKEDRCNEIVPGFWIGRRLYARELPTDIDLVVDLTSEFPEPLAVRTGRMYVCVPILDAHVSSEETVRELAARLGSWQGKVYLHCALGHGRSGMVAVLVVLARGLARDLKEAEKLVREARPGVKLTPGQRQLLRRILVAGSANHPPERYDQETPGNSGG